MYARLRVVLNHRESGGNLVLPATRVAIDKGETTIWIDSDDSTDTEHVSAGRIAIDRQHWDADVFVAY
jgi:hypothetical protein